VYDCPIDLEEPSMRSAVIVDAVRTPSGRRNGAFKDIHPVDLASIPLRALMERNASIRP
jgi:acetyl-CoA acyltransferase